MFAINSYFLTMHTVFTRRSNILLAERK